MAPARPPPAAAKTAAAAASVQPDWSDLPPTLFERE
jgi:hypothetical protein